MVQRYKFESKSQLKLAWCLLRFGCFQWFKDTNLKVNHNMLMIMVINLVLFPMVQRYKFESKSQLGDEDIAQRYGCFQWFKDTNLKVNHNGDVLRNNLIEVVSNGSKIQI